MNKLHLIILLIGISFFAYSQNYTISGNIKDGSSGEDLTGVNIFVKEKKGVGATTNIYGFYSLTLPKGKYTIIYSFIGMQDKAVKIVLDKNIRKDIELSSGAETLQEVTITGEKENKNVTENNIGVTTLKMKEVEMIPVLLGEQDIMKTFQLMPGIKSAGEGGSGFYVRGGSADQNLILLDGAPVYNASHLLGFFSVFNSDAIRDVKLYKGTAPAEYGGRLSSVMDIKMKEGNSKKLTVNGGIGLISSRLTIETPIVKNKGSILISGRRTYADVFLPLFNNELLKESHLYFYDLNMKSNYRIGANDRIFLSGYFGRDSFGLSDKFGFDWGNTTGTLRWNHIFNEKLFSNTTLIYSNYNYKIDIRDGWVQIGSQIEDFNFKQDFDYFLNNKNKIKIGANIIHHTFKPGEIDIDEEAGFNPAKIEHRYSLESAFYILNEQKIGSNFTINYGLRYSNFTQFGPGEIYTYNSLGDVLDSTTYGEREKIVTYHGFAPRIASTYKLNEVSSVKASISRNYQYLHMLSSSTSGTPLDVWMPSSNNIKPEIADQLALGYFRNFKDNLFEFSTEVYYKRIQNAVDYKTGAEVMLNEHAEGQLLFGDGRAYGVEFFLKKRKGKLTGWLSYTLARSEIRLNKINNGDYYPTHQDRAHDISVVAMYQITDRLNISGSWVYYTGNAVTFPSGKYYMNGRFYNFYTERNGYRMPDFHRLDLGVTLKNKRYKYIINADTGERERVKKKIESSWNLSVYNAYLRENAYMIEFREKEDDPTKTEAVQISLFKIIPSISYNFKF